MRFEILGKARRALFPVLCAAALLLACASKETQEIPDGMAVTVTLREVHRWAASFSRAQTKPPLGM